MTPETWQVDLNHSAVSLIARHMLISKVRGRFTRWSAKLHFDPIELTRSTVEVDIEAASIDTGVADRDKHLRSADFLDAATYPALHFRSRRVEVLSPQHFHVIGDLTIRGATREVVLDAEYAGQGKDPWHAERAGFSATASLSRKDFGLTWNQALEAGGVMVGDQVNVEIELEAIKQAAAKVA